MLAGKIYTIRGQKVMLDRDLAQIYGYTLKAFNKQVNNNIHKFDADFRFQLSSDEYDHLRSKIYAANISSKSRVIPHVYTEQGIYMLMTVLRGELATKQSIALIKLFKKLKDELISQNSAQLIMPNQYIELSTKIHYIEEDLRQTVKKSELHDFIAHFTDQNLGKQLLVLQGQIVEAYSAYQQIFAAARGSIVLIDNYLSMKTLLLFKSIPAEISVTIFTDKDNNGLHQKELEEFRREYPKRKIVFKKTKLKFHDRFIIIDFQQKTQEIYLCGSSLKDSGRRVTTIVKLQDDEIFGELFSKLE